MNAVSRVRDRAAATRKLALLDCAKRPAKNRAYYSAGNNNNGEGGREREREGERETRVGEKALKGNEHRRRRRFDDPGDSLSEFDSRCSDAEYKR